MVKSLLDILVTIDTLMNFDNKGRFLVRDPELTEPVNVKVNSVLESAHLQKFILF